MSNIKELCKDVSFNRISNWINITDMKLCNVVSNLGIKGDEVILFYDSTLFENGKNGLAICESGIYWKNTFSSPRYLSWDAFRKERLTYDRCNIYFGDKGSFFVYETETEYLLQTLNNIRMNIKIENFVEKTEGFFGLLKGAIDFLNELDTGNTQNDSNTQPQINNNSNQVMQIESSEKEMVYNTAQSNNNDEYLYNEIQNVKTILTYLNKDVIGDIFNLEVNNSEDINAYIFNNMLTIIILTGDEDLMSLLEEETKKNIIETRESLELQLDLVESVLNSDSLNNMGQEKMSIKKAINIYHYRIMNALEEYDEADDMEEIEEIYDNVQSAAKEFRKSLKKMIKVCNLIMEKIYVDSM